MIRLTYLFLLLFPSRVQKTFPLPFFLWLHVSVPVSFHVVHPSADNSRSLKCKRFSMSPGLQTFSYVCTNQRANTLGYILGTTTQIITETDNPLRLFPLHLASALISSRTACVVGKKIKFASARRREEKSTRRWWKVRKEERKEVTNEGFKRKKKNRGKEGEREREKKRTED